MQAIENFNWVDIVLLLLLLRSVYIGARIGLTGEFFKLLGTILSILIGFHYNKQIAAIFSNYINIPGWIAEIVVLSVIILIIRVIFKYGVVLLLKVLNIQFILQLERIGGILVALVRSLLTGGLFLILILIIPQDYFRKSIHERSTLAPYYVKATNNIYKSLISLIPKQEPVDILKGKKGAE